MNKLRKKRLINVLALIGTSFFGVSLILYALNNNLDYFYTPSEIVEAQVPESKKIKLGGMVKDGSIEMEGSEILFQITDFKNTISVSYKGVVPDLFKEGSGIVAYGMMKDGDLVAENIFAKHDENYMPPNMDISAE